MKMFMALLTKNQEIGSNLSMKIFMALLTKKKSTTNRVSFTNEDIYGPGDKNEGIYGCVDKKSTRNRV